MAQSDVIKSYLGKYRYRDTAYEFRFGIGTRAGSEVKEVIPYSIYDEDYIVYDGEPAKALNSVFHDYVENISLAKLGFYYETDKLKNIEIEKFMPDLNRTTGVFNSALKCVMNIMKKAYPNAPADAVMENLPNLDVEYSNNKSQAAAVYSLSTNKVIINDYEDILKTRTGLSTLFHEVTHMSSTRISLVNDSFYSGFFIDRGFGYGINEGITEMFTEDRIGTDGGYFVERRMAKMLRALYGNDEKFANKFFMNDFSLFLEIFNSEDEALAFIKTLDFLEDVDEDIFGFVKEKIDGRFDDYVNESEERYRDMTVDEIDEDETNFIFALLDERLASDYPLADIDFISNAESMLLNAYENRLGKLKEKDREKLFKEMVLNFVTVATIENNKDVPLLSREILDMEDLKNVSERFIKINDKYFSGEKQISLISEIVKESREKLSDEESEI